MLLDQGRLSALGITPREVSTALAAENRNVSAGDMLDTSKEVLVRTIGEYSSVDEIADVVIATRDGRSIFVRDVGEVRDGFREIKNELWVDGKVGMRMYISKQSGRQHRRGGRDPEAGGRLHPARLRGPDRSADALRRIDLHQAVGSATCSAARSSARSWRSPYCCSSLRDLRATLVVATAIPISVLATIALMYFNGYTLNVVSLGGIALGNRHARRQRDRGAREHLSAPAARARRPCLRPSTAPARSLLRSSRVP